MPVIMAIAVLTLFTAVAASFALTLIAFIAALFTGAVFAVIAPGIQYFIQGRSPGSICTCRNAGAHHDKQNRFYIHKGQYFTPYDTCTGAVVEYLLNQFHPMRT